MASYEQAFANVATIFNISKFNDHQKDAILTFLQAERDIFINLPTGFGKSLVFQALPLILDYVSDQLSRSRTCSCRRIPVSQPNQRSSQEPQRVATSISDIENEEERREVERGCFSLVYGTPEAWLLNL